MPELPEVEKLRRQLKHAFVGRKLQTAEWTEGAHKHFRNFTSTTLFAHLRTGITDVTRIGKNLLIHTHAGSILQWHLNSTGWWYADNQIAAAQAVDPIYKAFIVFTQPDAPYRFKLTLDDGAEWVYRDTRTWGRGYLWNTTDPLDGTAGDLHLYGPDWQGARPFAISTLLNWRPQSPRKVKEVLLDQRLTAGIGNWICIEALHRASIHPYTPWSSLTPDDKRRLCDAVSYMVDTALATPDYSFWRVFSRRDQWCLKPSCTGVIQYSKDGPKSLRGSYYCTTCQPLL